MQEYLGQLLLFIRDPEETPAKEDLEAFGRQAFSMKKEVEESMNGFLADRTLLKEAIPNRKKWYARLRGRSDLQELGMGSEAFVDDELDKVVSDLDAAFVRLSEQFSQYWNTLDELISSIDTLTLDQARGRLAESLNELTGMFLELFSGSGFSPVGINRDGGGGGRRRRGAWEIASAERLDWMNARRRWWTPGGG